jgi:hypothetical protein
MILKTIKAIKTSKIKIKRDKNVLVLNDDNFDEIQQDDVLIWVGCERIPDFNLLNKKGIYTIYYNTEPDTNMYTSNEIWTYSKYLFDNYNKNDTNQIVSNPFTLNNLSIIYNLESYQIRNETIEITVTEISTNEKITMFLNSNSE